MISLFRKAIFKKIFLSFLIVIIVYTLIIMVVTVSQERSRNRMKWNNMNELFLERESNLIDYRLDVSLNAVNLISQQQSIVDFLNSNSFNYEVYNHLFNDLTGNLFSSHQSGFNIAVSKGFGESITSSDGYFLFKDYLAFTYMDQNMGELKKFMESKDNNDLRCFDADNKLIIVKKKFYSQEQKNLFFFIVWEKKDLLITTLPNNSGVFGLVDGANLNYTTSEHKERLPFIKSGVMIENQIVEQTIEDKTAYQKRSNTIPTLHYLYVVNLNEMMVLPLKTILSIMVILFGSLLIGFLLTYSFSKKNYSPFMEIIKNIRKDESLASSYIKNELEYIISTIQDINTVNQNLVQLQENSLEDLQESFFKNLIYQNITEQDIQNKIVPLRLNPYKEGGTLVILSTDGISKWESDLTESNILIVRKKFLSNFKDKNTSYGFLSFPINYKCFCLFFLEKNQKNILSVLDEMTHRIGSELGVKITFSISKSFTAITDLPRAFKEVSLEMDLNFSFIDTDIVTQDNNSIPSKKEYSYSVETESMLIKYIQNREFESARELISQVLIDNFGKSKISIYSMIDFKNAFINTIKRILNKYNIVFNDFYKQNESLFIHLNSQDADLLIETFHSLFEKLMENIGVEKQYKLSTVEKVIAYIQNNYTKDLSLSEVADYFHLSESYVSKLVKEHLKSSFKNYVNQLKVEKAKQLLLSGKYMVAEVGEMVGYKNVNTFIRIFKQQEGITPGKYVANRNVNEELLKSN